MLRTAVSLVTGFGVLWHVVVGCCAHHQHDEPAALAASWAHDEAATAGAAKPHACCRTSHRHDDSHSRFAHESPRSCGSDAPHSASHEEASHEESPSACRPAQLASPSAPSPQPAEPCDGVECSFLTAQFVHPADYTPLAPAMASSSPPEVSLVAAPAGFGGALVARGDDRPPPLRSHLALGVLLI